MISNTTLKPIKLKKESKSPIDTNRDPTKMRAMSTREPIISKKIHTKEENTKEEVIERKSKLMPGKITTNIENLSNRMTPGAKNKRRLQRSIMITLIQTALEEVKEDRLSTHMIEITIIEIERTRDILRSTKNKEIPNGLLKKSLIKRNPKKKPSLTIFILMLQGEKEEESVLRKERILITLVLKEEEAEAALEMTSAKDTMRMKITKTPSIIGQLNPKKIKKPKEKRKKRPMKLRMSLTKRNGEMKSTEKIASLTTAKNTATRSHTGRMKKAKRAEEKKTMSKA
jgi:hypothetical protein